MTYGLTPRPLYEEDVAAVLVALAQVRRDAPVVDATPAWRFSGRWFHHGALAPARTR
ncbi:MAG TPA: hypothetical protein VFN54_04990 [Acidimicrobiales bacterium]|nr:hypothetical protein [Acidimicrobiales bacterium]